jgi:signal transduction histidine kinase
LGLSIVYQIVKDHGGSINVRSRERNGTTITIELPSEFKSQTPAEENKEIPQQSRLESFLTVQQNEK